VDPETQGKAGPVSIYLAEPRNSRKTRVFSRIHVFQGGLNGVFHTPRRSQVETRDLGAKEAFREPKV